VPVRDGVFDEAGDYNISGVPGTGSKITLRFSDPGGAVTGRLFPTGNPVDILDVPEVGRIKLTIMDAANPVVMVPAKEIGLSGTEIEEIESSEFIRAKLEAIRCIVAVQIGLAETPQEANLLSQAVPKIACVAPSQKYQTLGAKTIEVNEIDLVARIMSMGTLHKSYAVSGAISTAGAAMTEGTVVHEMVNPEAGNKNMLRIGHPGGIIEVGAKIEKKGKHIEYKEAVLARTARRLMEGYVLVPQKYFRKD
jgi:2-methylaconitate cis-trans-isomerase PrpF